MLIGRVIGWILFAGGLASGGMILRGAERGLYAFGLIRTWAAFGALTAAGLLIASLFSGVSAAGRAARWAGTAILALGVLSGVILVLNKSGTIRLADTLQPWVLLAVCLVVGGVMTYGTRS